MLVLCSVNKNLVDAKCTKEVVVFRLTQFNTISKITFLIQNCYRINLMYKRLFGKENWLDIKADYVVG